MKSHCYSWDESQGSCEVATKGFCFLKGLDLRGFKLIHLFSDR